MGTSKSGTLSPDGSLAAPADCGSLFQGKIAWVELALRSRRPVTGVSRTLQARSVPGRSPIVGHSLEHPCFQGPCFQGRTLRARETPVAGRRDGTTTMCSMAPSSKFVDLLPQLKDRTHSTGFCNTRGAHTDFFFARQKLCRSQGSLRNLQRLLLGIV